MTIQKLFSNKKNLTIGKGKGYNDALLKREEIIVKYLEGRSSKDDYLKDKQKTSDFFCLADVADVMSH